MTNEKQSPKKCAYCGKPIETLTRREIFRRDRDPRTRRACVKRDIMDFCSPVCGGNYQMGCEG